MNWYTVRLTLRRPTGTPWQADTIFGHLCWALRHRRSEPALGELLDWYREGMPPFLLSDGFPGDLLPRPLSLSPPRAETREAFREGRDARKQTYLTMSDFRRALAGEPFIPERVEDTGTTRATLKNQISRLTGTTGEEGNLFPFTEYWIPQVTIYLKIEVGFEGEVKEMFEWLAETGYGKRKSVGYGAIGGLDFRRFDGFPAPAGANGFVSLSPFVPAAGDPTEGRWRTRLKRGRLGEDFAIGGQPFKRPILMLAPGSVFADSPVRESYGRMVADVSLEHPEVVQYALALPVPLKLPATVVAEGG
ncbi:MAG: hypothetical protein HYY01_04645 [Chloroflexi bacterium]|nr:hypothetical protein [Chloroflexota bacterium]